MLEVTDVTKSFGGMTAIYGLSFQVENNQIISIIGPNGAGKTTLFNLISGYLHPTSGKIFFKGENITNWRPSGICKKGLTRTFQIVQPFMNLNILQNVIIGALNWAPTLSEAKDYSLQILEKVKLIDRRDHLANTLTLAGKKRLELARAIATKPTLLMLDEVMAGLNKVEGSQLMDLIEKIHTEQKMTILFIEHILNIVMQLSNKIIVLNHGSKIAEGTPNEIAQDERTIEAYLGRKRL
ncbi:MAG: ABC transporter ATP-binding protein [Deltaproteobacteria bacterium]|nr:ABC transporter ATP-binding protein [Deltaproteobacteria bacterium]